ncbi:MAG: GDP-mannose 4,6-dehydratase [Chloroflexota bacterium]|nr:GDP-mannose 4,6-dehydratase [Chloroflexota bacterium]
MAQRTALITGVTGQDGGYLAQLLQAQGYRVVGVTRRTTANARDRLPGDVRDLELVSADLLDQGSLFAIVDQVQPDEIYNLAAQTFVPASWQQPLLTAEVTGLGLARLLEAVRLLCPTARVFQASSSEMFGLAASSPQNEETPFHPRSPYGTSKLYAHWIAANYRESYGLFVASGIMFNHESPRRGAEFVTRKISRAAARIARGLEATLALGNLDARRDWGYAPDFTRAMHAMLQTREPLDLVIATGESHTVREFCETAFSLVGLDWQRHVTVDPTLIRPAEVDALVGDASRAEKLLGWRPTMSFPDLVREMVETDVDLLATASGPNLELTGSVRRTSR